MRRALLLIGGAILLLALAAPGLANNVWSDYHWADGSTDGSDIDDHTDGGVALTLFDHLTKYNDQYGEVVKNWQAPDSPLALGAGTADRPDACDNVSDDPAGADILGEIHVCNAEYGENGWLGLARIWLSPEGHIDAAVALMNDTYFNSGTYANDNAKQHVLCQEVGHTFGLGHQAGRKSVSCMNDRWGLFDLAAVGPNAHDFDMLNQIYVSGSTDGGDPVTKPCKPNRKKTCPAASNVHMAARAGGGWIITYTFPVDRSLR